MWDVVGCLFCYFVLGLLLMYIVVILYFVIVLDFRAITFGDYNDVLNMIRFGFDDVFFFQMF